MGDVELSIPQRRLLRALARNPSGFEVGGRHLATGDALARRGLARKEGARFFAVTDEGRTRYAAMIEQAARRG